MSKEIIIDGVNVAECMYFDNVMCQAEKRADGNTITECFGFTCYYKRLKRLQTENEGLKSTNDFVVKQLERRVNQLREYHKALEEIREIAGSRFVSGINEEADAYNQDMSRIYNKINEVLDERN